MDAYRMPDGRLMVPRRAEAEDGTRGDGMVVIPVNSEEGKEWVKWYEDRGEEVPDVPESPPNIH